MADHGSRAHATWSASSTARNWACPGVLRLSSTVAQLDKESQAAAWGTACHQIAEHCLRDKLDASHFVGTEQKTKSFTIEVDDEMAETAQMYVDEVNGALMHAGTGADEVNYTGPLRWIEERFSLASLNPAFDAGGTADAIVYFPAGALLEIIDLKGGRGVVVEAKGNPQLRTYALGALLAHPELKVEHVKVTIVQPRAQHRDGRIRSETFHVVDLLEWTADLLSAMRLAKEAWDEADAGGSLLPYLHAGSHCKFCPAAGICPRLQKQAADAVGLWFDDLDQPKLANAPDQLSPAELARVLNAADMVEDWLNACRRLAHTLAESGTAIPDYVLVEKTGTRKWKGEEADTFSALRNRGLKQDDLYTEKLKSPAQIEKLLGKRKDEIKDLWTRETTGTNLVRADKTTRPAVASTVERHFDVLN